MPWHPSLIHFPIAFWLLGSLLMLINFSWRRKELAFTTWLLLAVAAITAIPAAMSGQNSIQALSSLPISLQRHQQFGNALPWLMMGVVLLRGHQFLRKKVLFPPWIWLVLALFTSILVIFTAHQGGISVYIHGIGTP